MITFGSLFAGIGGIDLGLERVGMECRWQVEIDPWCRKVLAKHWPDVSRYKDVRECNADNLEAVDLIAGGFPCQDVSLAGKRAGLEGKRTTLWSEFARIIRELRPQWVLAENVPGLLSSDSGRFFGNVLRDLAACGYDAEWDCIPAAAVGAPHRRDRVFIVAHASGIRCDAGRTTEPLQGLRVYGKTRNVANASCSGAGKVFCQRRGQQGQLRGDSWGAGQYWAVEPPVGRVANGVPSRVDRLRGLGNAVVPQVIEHIGRLILEADIECHRES